jgi:agmatine deiminase
MKNFNKAAGFLCIALLSSGAFALDINKPLPNWLGPSEKILESLPDTSVNAAPPSDFRLPAEYEPAGAVVVGWAAYTDILTAIAQAVTGPAKARIWAVAGPESITGVPAASYSRINAKINSVWVRDYGPFGVSASQNKIGIVDTTYRHYQYRTDDDAMPSNLGKAMGISVYGSGLILDGGNVMVDSAGNLFMTVRTYAWNSSMSKNQVDAELKQYFNIKNVYTFEYPGYPGEPADGTGHIDMFMKLLNDHTVLISVADTEPFKSNAEKAMAFFKDRSAPDGQPYEVITVKGWSASGTWYTYTNSLIVNKVAIIPSYSGHAQEEAAARAAYEAGIQNVTVVPVRSDSSIRSGGSIHCVTQIVPKMGNLTTTGVPEFAETLDAGAPAFKDMDLVGTPGGLLMSGSPALSQLAELAPVK